MKKSLQLAISILILSTSTHAAMRIHHPAFEHWLKRIITSAGTTLYPQIVFEPYRESTPHDDLPYRSFDRVSTAVNNAFVDNPLTPADMAGLNFNINQLSMLCQRMCTLFFAEIFAREKILDSCECVPPVPRIALIIYLLQDCLAKYSTQNPLAITSIASGALLQDYLLLNAFIMAGYMHIQLNIIDAHNIPIPYIPRGIHRKISTDKDQFAFDVAQSIELLEQKIGRLTPNFSLKRFDSTYSFIAYDTKQQHDPLENTIILMIDPDFRPIETDSPAEANMITLNTDTGPHDTFYLFLPHWHQPHTYSAPSSGEQRLFQRTDSLNTTDQATIEIRDALLEHMNKSRKEIVQFLMSNQIPEFPSVLNILNHNIHTQWYVEANIALQDLLEKYPHALVYTIDFLDHPTTTNIIKRINPYEYINAIRRAPFPHNVPYTQIWPYNANSLPYPQFFNLNPSTIAP